jgi:hypothetical protein
MPICPAVAVARGAFNTAVREMKLVATATPESLKTQHADLIMKGRQ